MLFGADLRLWALYAAIGAGGLGAPALMYMAAASVGTIGGIDDDAFEMSHLQRKIIHTDARIGMAKVFSAMQMLGALTPHILIRPYNRPLDGDTAALIADYDLVLDGSDNLATRYLVNKTCAETGVTPFAGIIGSHMANATVKFITGAGGFDTLHSESRIITTKSRADCTICGAAPETH